MASGTPTSSTPASGPANPTVRESTHATTQAPLSAIPTATTADHGRTSTIAAHPSWSTAVTAKSQASAASSLWLPAAAACTRPAPAEANAATRSQVLGRRVMPRP